MLPDPPCARCRRRTITCEFLPSRRSGRMSVRNCLMRTDQFYWVEIDHIPSSQYEARQALKREEEARQRAMGSEAPLSIPPVKKKSSRPPPVTSSSFQESYTQMPVAGPSNTASTFNMSSDPSQQGLVFTSSMVRRPFMVCIHI